MQIGLDGAELWRKSPKSSRLLNSRLLTFDMFYRFLLQDPKQASEFRQRSCRKQTNHIEEVQHMSANLYRHKQSASHICIAMFMHRNMDHVFIACTDALAAERLSQFRFMEVGPVGSPAASTKRVKIRSRTLVDMPLPIIWPICRSLTPGMPL